jgi:hypothetical protein
MKITAEFEGIDHTDYPDFVDAHIVRAWEGDRELSEEEVEELNDDPDRVYELLMDYLY